MRQVSPGAIAERLNSGANTAELLGSVLGTAAQAQGSVAAKLGAKKSKVSDSAAPIPKLRQAWGLRSQVCHSSLTTALAGPALADMYA